MKKIWVYDIEAFYDFFCIVFIDYHSDEQVVFEISKFKNELGEIKQFIKTRVAKWFGYANNNYDDIVMTWLLKQDNITAHEIYKYSTSVIESEAQWVNMPFESADIFRMLHFNRFKVSLKWCQIMMNTLDIEELRNFKDPVTTREEADDVIYYCTHDVQETKKVIFNHPKDLELRRDLLVEYPMLKNPFSMSNTAIGKNTMLEDYCNLTGEDKWVVNKLRTEYKYIVPSDVIDSRIVFQTKQLQDFLIRLKNSKVNLAFKEFKEYIQFDEMHYDLGKGGVHGVQGNRVKKGKKTQTICNLIYQEDDNFEIVDFDWGSYYPMAQCELGIAPKHLKKEPFLKLIRQYTNDRLHYKATGQKKKANALKIKINSLYGLLGDEHSFLYDKKAMYSVTINGQLLLLMLIERMSLLGIKCIYANTDGACFLVPKILKEEFNNVCQKFFKVVNIPQETKNFKKCYIKDVNNFVIIESDNELKLKGCYVYEDLPYNKNNSNLISKEAAVKHLVNNIPFAKTIQEENSIFPFCNSVRAQKTSKGMPTFKWFEKADRDFETSLQKTIRYAVTKTGGVLKKTYPSEGEVDEEHVEAHPQKGRFWFTTILTHINKDKTNKSDYDVDETYYIYEASKLCNFRLNYKQAEKNQMTLF